MSKPFLITLAIVIGVVLLFISFFGGTYNQFVSSQEKVSEAWAQVENVYQRRLDLVPNLVETVKGYAAHESSTFQSVVEARSKISQMKITSDIINDPAKMAQFQASQGAMSYALGRLLAVAERYPDLKASQNFLALQSQLEGTENRIAVERKRFNEAAREFNVQIRVFPNNLIARFMGFSPKAYFEADTAAAAAPKVSF